MHIIGYVDKQSEWLGYLSHIMFSLGYTHWMMDTHGRNKDIIHCLMVCIIYNPQSKHCSLTNHTTKQQQYKAHGREIHLVQAKNAGEQPGKGKSSQSMIVACKCTYTSDIRMALYHSVLPKGRSMFPSALVLSALVPNAIIVARLNLLSHSKRQPL